MVRESLIDAPIAARAGLAAQWRENAAKEHVSIAAFAELTLDSCPRTGRELSS